MLLFTLGLVVGIALVLLYPWLKSLFTKELTTLAGKAGGSTPTNTQQK